MQFIISECEEFKMYDIFSKSENNTYSSDITIFMKERYITEDFATDISTKYISEVKKVQKFQTDCIKKRKILQALDKCKRFNFSFFFWRMYK